MNDSPTAINSCDTEPIHILGKVQSHGFLIAANLHSRFIEYVSENINTFVGRDAKSFLGESLTDVENKLIAGIEGTQFLFYLLVKAEISGKNIEALNPFLIKLGQKPFNIIVTVYKEQIILEFEPANPGSFDSYKTIGGSVSNMLSGSSLTSLLDNAAKEIKNIIGYDRVMVYQFDEDGHGQVIAEEKLGTMHPFLGLKFPASDIPKQAKELYKINLTRIIADVESSPSCIIAHSRALMPLDLTHSELRAVSPMHIRYLGNMGVGASFSISLISKGELWGLIACHNDQAKFISYNGRMVSKQIGQVLSSSVEFRQGEQDSEKFISLNTFVDRLTGFLENEKHIVEALTTHVTTLKDITDASGVVLILEGETTCMGQTPDKIQIAELAGWLFDTMPGNIYSTSALSMDFGPASAYSAVGSGILACILSRELKEIIIWFKPEQIRHVSWAGNPQKTFEINLDEDRQLSPRESFDAWAVIVKNSSDKWSRAETSAAMNICGQILYLMKRKAMQTGTSDEKRRLTYQEPEISLADKTSAASPLPKIKTYLEQTSDNDLDQNARDLLVKMTKQADKMDFLTAEIMNYSRVGREEILSVELNMGAMIKEIKLETMRSVQAENLEFTVGETPVIRGDQILINQVFRNLIHNAVKYSSRSDPAIVKVEGKLSGEEVVYSVSDNGIGIDTGHSDQIYNLFKRMDNARAFEGAGVGLAIVKRIIEKHRARIWFDSEPGSQTTFYLAFPVQSSEIYLE